jgi:hypothetical protein
VFDRYKESNGDYRSQARLVTFGLRDNAKLRERLFAGTLHCLEIAYASDEVRTCCSLVQRPVNCQLTVSCICTVFQEHGVKVNAQATRARRQGNGIGSAGFTLSPPFVIGRCCLYAISAS